MPWSRRHAVLYDWRERGTRRLCALNPRASRASTPADLARSGKIYSHPPATPFEEVAVIDVTSKSVFGTGGQKSIDKVIERLKIEAAKLGAIGVMLEGFSDAETGSIGTGVGSNSYGNHSAVGVGVDGSLGIYKETGYGDAIYVQPTGN